MKTNPLVFDPRTAIAAFVSVVVWIGAANSLTPAMAWVGAGLLAVVASTIRRGEPFPWRIFSAALIAGFLTLALYLVFNSAAGGESIRLGPLVTTSGSLEAGLRMAARLVALVMVAYLFVSGVDALRLSAGLTKLLLPLRRIGVPVLNVFYFTYFLISMTPRLVDESRLLRLAQRSRGWNDKQGFLWRARSSAALVLPTLNAGLRRGDQIAFALTARGFTPARAPSIVSRLRLGALDWTVLLVLAASWLIWWRV